MKLKIFVAAALSIAIFLTGTILLLGFVQGNAFPYIYFIFVLFLLVSVVVLSKKIFVEKSDLILAIAMVFLIAIYITFFISSLKTYADKTQELNNNSTLVSEVDSLTNANEYSISYINYLNNQIKISQENSEFLQGQIDTFIANSMTQVPPVNNPNPREEIERDEEDEEDD